MKTKILITCVFSLGLLVLGGLSIESFLHKDYVNGLFFSHSLFLLREYFLKCGINLPKSNGKNCFLSREFR